MAGTSNFGGKKAAPFLKGGKRRKAVLAKHLRNKAKGKGKDLSNSAEKRITAAAKYRAATIKKG